MPCKSEKQRKWMHANKSKIAKKLKNYKKGGLLKGPNHEEGGIVIEVEGDEFITKKDSVNEKTIDTLKYINEHGDIPFSDARERRGK